MRLLTLILSVVGIIEAGGSANFERPFSGVGDSGRGVGGSEQVRDDLGKE